MKFRDEILEALKLAEVLVPPVFRGLYQVLLLGVDTAWREITTENKDSGEDSPD